ncbi:hypothetical protein CRG96_02285 [Escherichia sp. E4930]|nr:hypothetical protein CRG96_02285 [Escherichia sp. E4930]
MNRSIITALGVLILTLPVAGFGARYIASSGTGSQTESWIDSNGERPSTSTTIVYANPGQTEGWFPDTWLNEPNHYQYNMEWLDSQHVLSYPPSCRFSNSVYEAKTKILLLKNDTTYVAVAQSNEVTTGQLDGLTLKAHLEPVNAVGNQTRVDIFLPGTIECDPGLGEFTATVTGFGNAQKWWDGGTPNWRRTTQTLSVTYKPLVTLSAEFSPQTISMTGTVNTYIENSTDLIVTTSGGTNVEILWPEVNTVEYEQAGVWVKGHTQSVSVTDGANKINKRIRVRSSVAGSTTISVPVTMTLS